MRVRVLAAAALISTALATAPAAGPATAATVGSPCPAPMPVAEVAAGQQATGLTVSTGTVPQQFTARILGVLTGGIAPGMDLILAETDSAAIQSVGGIWAGMSGSPVYAGDGRLIGAVAYGLSLGPSPVAGITPAADMMRLLSGDAAAATALRSAQRVALPGALQRRLVQAGAASTAQAAGGMTQLPVPLGVSGVSSARLGKVSELASTRLRNVRLFATGSTPGGPGDPGGAADIVAGGNFAAALSTGDLTIGGVGTATAVCGSEVLAFGHPAFFLGATTLSAHAADALFVQGDPTLTPFKVANIGARVGVLDQDRLAGVRTTLGATPPAVPVTSTLSVPATGASRAGATSAHIPAFIDFVTAIHLLVNFDRTFDAIGPGTSALRWTVSGTRADGSPWRLVRSNRYADRFDIAIGSIFELAEQVSRLENNPFESTRITGIAITGSAEPTYTAYALAQVLVRTPAGTLVPAPTDRPLTVVAGTRLNLRAVLTPYRNIGPARTVDLSVPVPAGTVGTSGQVAVTGGFSEPLGPPAQSFDALLRELSQAAPNNSVNATLRLVREGPTGTSSVTRLARSVVDRVVAGDRSLPIQVVAPAAPNPAVVDGVTWKLRASLSAGAPTTTYAWGRSTDAALMGDWDGDGTTSPALFRAGTWMVRDESVASPVRTFTFGQPGDVPVVGDWDGDGRDGVGVYRGGRFLLRAAATAGPASADFAVTAIAGAQPVAGDWDGDGVDTVGTFAAGRWTLLRANAAGAATLSASFGRAGDVPLVGDWNANGGDGVGIYRVGRWALTSTLSTGVVSRTFLYGGPTSRPVVWR